MSIDSRSQSKAKVLGKILVHTYLEKEKNKLEDFQALQA
jgi:hypothetical protein